MTPDSALGVGATVVAEAGRWVVFLSVDFWDAAANDNPIETVWCRIADFPTAEAAHLAANYYQRGADRGCMRWERGGFGGRIN